ncbi:MAG: CotH kinase family protein [Desulfobacteraceae bacterium]|nr:CotH kinase family protein [Desulfobacteraceae bacterium]
MNYETKKMISVARELVDAIKRCVLKIYKIRFFYSFLISLFLVIICAVIVSNALSDLYDYDRIHKTELSGDSLKFFLKNWIRKEWMRRTAAKTDNESPLKTFHINIDGKDIEKLNSDLPQSGKGQYVQAFMRVSDMPDVKRVKLRYRGANNYHWLYTQKSLRIKLRKKDTYNLEKKLNLINPPHHHTLPLECVDYGISRRLGLIAPDYFPIRVFINGENMGVYSYLSQADESLLRKHKRMPGSIYEGEPAPKGEDGVSLLWRNEQYWKKAAARNAEQKGNREDIRLLIKAINQYNDAKFYDFVNTFLDKDKFCTFFALDVIFGSGHHDYHHNHRIYFDPYKGRFEPIQWDMRYWTPREQKDCSYNPLLHRIKMNPILEAERDRSAYEIMEQFSNESLFEELSKYENLILRDLSADKFRDNAVMAPYPLRWWFSEPFTIEEFKTSISRLKDILRKRRCYLVRLYNDVDARYFSKKIGSDYCQVVFRINGNSGIEIDLLKMFRNQGGLDQNDIIVYQDTNLNGILDGPDRLISERKQYLYPGRKVVTVQNVLPVLQGNIEAVSAPLFYSYIVKGGACPGKETLPGKNGITGKEVKIEYLPFQIADESESIHPWRLVAKEGQEKVLTGTIHVRETLVFDKRTYVKILPGTSFVMYPGKSIFFYGRVRAEGSRNRPIRFVAFDDKKPWGVIAVQGKDASGTSFIHCKFSDGSVDTRNLIDYTGQFNIHDLTGFVVSHCQFEKNHLGDDNVHIAYAKGTIENCGFNLSPGDALDVDIGQVTIKDSIFLNSGNDALDLMTSRAKVQDCLFVKSGDKGISMGEWSSGLFKNDLFYECNIGIEVKDKSAVVLENILIVDSGQKGINLYNKNLRYDEGGAIDAQTVYILGKNRDVTADNRSSVKIDRIVETYPDLSQVGFLNRKFRGLRDWNHLKEELRGMAGNNG